MIRGVLANKRVTASRQFDRVEPEHGQPIRVDFNGDDFIDVLEATDISCGGLGVTVPHGFDGCNLDSLVSLIIQLPDPVNECVSVKGQVIHLNEARFGVAFVTMNPSAQEKIQEYIDYRLGVRPSWRARFDHWFGA